MNFGEHNIEQAIAMTQAAGLHYLYHSSPYETWGHFQLKAKLFRYGWDGLRTCVEKARQAGMRVGGKWLPPGHDCSRGPTLFGVSLRQWRRGGGNGPCGPTRGPWRS